MYLLKDVGGPQGQIFSLKEEGEELFSGRETAEIAEYIVENLPELAEDLAHEGVRSPLITLEGLPPMTVRNFFEEVRSEFSNVNMEEMFDQDEY